MRVAWIQSSGAALAAALMLLAGPPLNAADEGVVHYVAEELGNRTKAPEAEQTTPKGLSDSAVRVMSTFALSILPDEVPDPSGEMVKLDKSDPNKYLIPLDDARRVIRVATRSAYAEVCQLYELEKANFDAMIRTERMRAWTAEQMMFLHALHTFATSYFAGNVKITEQAEAGKADSVAKEGAAAANNASGAATTITTKKLECMPGQKEKVTAAINAYVRSAPPPTAAAPQAPLGAAPSPAAAAQQTAPVTDGAN
jgi:hypothetical protein